MPSPRWHRVAGWNRSKLGFHPEDDQLNVAAPTPDSHTVNSAYLFESDSNKRKKELMEKKLSSSF